jgi:hypothetical protein
MLQRFRETLKLIGCNLKLRNIKLQMQNVTVFTAKLVAPSAPKPCFGCALNGSLQMLVCCFTDISLCTETI